jgi:hypothetical protein
MAKDVEMGYSKYEEPSKSYEYSPSTIPPPTAGMVLAKTVNEPLPVLISV